MQALKLFRRRAAKETPQQLPAPFARSQLLAPLPDLRMPGRLVRIVLRMTLIIATGWFVVTLIQAVRHKELGERVYAQPLYWAHDAIYLPIKGYTFTQFYPASLIWYTLAATLFGAWLCCFAVDRSLVRMPQIWLARLWVRSLPFHRLLVAGTKVLRHIGLSPDLLVAAVEHERDQAVWQLAAGKRGAGRRLVRRARLLIRLRLLYDDRAMLLHALLDWQDAMLLLRFRRDPAAGKLAGDVVPLCRRVLQPLNQSFFEAAWFHELGFDRAACAADLLRQAVLASDAAKIFGDAEERDALAVATPLAAIGALVAATEWRCRRVDALRARLESGLRDPIAATGLIDGLADELGLASEPDAELPFLGAIALRCALAAAHAAGSADLALAAIEAIEALRLALDCVAISPRVPPALLRTIACARAWAGDLPRPPDYQMAASLTSQAVTRQRQQYDLDMMDNQLLRYADDIVGERVSTLYQAAGSERQANLLQQQDEAP